MAPRRAGALVAAGAVDALVGAGLRQPLTLINVCPQHRDRPAPGKDERTEEREEGRKEEEKGATIMQRKEMMNGKNK